MLGSKNRSKNVLRTRTCCSVVMFTTAGPTFSTAATVAVRRRNGSCAFAALAEKAKATASSDAIRGDFRFTAAQPRDVDLAEQERLLAQAEHAFTRHFARRATLAVRAPGRVNLIGEHTDYNDGLVLPCAIDRATLVLAAPRDDGAVRAISTAQNEAVRFSLDALARAGDWADYVRAPAFALREAGQRARGADLAIASDVPLGAGLSSSAALGVATTLALAAVSEIALPLRRAADLAHHGENHFVGIGCGILDPYASALGERDRALRIDCRARSVESLPLPPHAVWLVADSGAQRELARGGYRARVAECAAALAQAKRAGIAAPDARALRDLEPAALPALARALPEPLLRRARHVVTENARVDAFAAALGAGDLAEAGALMRESHASLRDDYAVSTPELDYLCALGAAAPGCHGSRLTGAGFGGCTLHLVDGDASESVAHSLESGFAKRFGSTPRVWRVRASEGARRIAL
jgi:galactokinase